MLRSDRRSPFGLQAPSNEVSQLIDRHATRPADGEGPHLSRCEQLVELGPADPEPGRSIDHGQTPTLLRRRPRPEVTQVGSTGLRTRHVHRSPTCDTAAVALKPWGAHVRPEAASASPRRLGANP